MGQPTPPLWTISLTGWVHQQHLHPSSVTCDGWVEAMRQGSVTCAGWVEAMRRGSVTCEGRVEAMRQGSFTCERWVEAMRQDSVTYDCEVRPWGTAVLPVRCELRPRGGGRVALQPVSQVVECFLPHVRHSPFTIETCPFVWLSRLRREKLKEKIKSYL